MYNDIAILINKIKTDNVDEYGDDIFEEERSEVFVNVKSVKYSEFYSAHIAGFNPEIIFEIADYYDYKGQPLIEYDGEIYKVIRTYRTTISLQIVCQHYDGG